MINNVRASYRTVVAAGKDFVDDEATTRAAALAFYAALSFAPLLILMLWVTSVVGPDAQQALVEQVRRVMGEGASATVGQVIANTQARPSLGTMSSLISVGALLFSATSVFAQLQQTLNRIWDVEAKPSEGIKTFIRTRLLSMAMLGAVGFLLIVSLGVSTVAAFLLARLGPLAALASFMTNVIVFSVVFAGIYRIVPDCKVETKDALIGGILTGVLFAFGIEVIGLYLGRSSVGSAYGAAGSLLVLLVWAYISGMVVLFGAELTQAYAVRYGSGIKPKPHAVPIYRKRHGRSGADVVAPPASKSTA